MIDGEAIRTFYQNVTRVPKMGNKGPRLNDSVLQSLRIMDMQDAIGVGHWYNLPKGLSQELIERILYYRGSGIFFYMESNKTFYFLPYVGKGLNVYGGYLTATPLPFNGTVSSDNLKEYNGLTKERIKKEQPWIDGLDLTIQREINTDGINLDLMTKSCVILNDYSIQIVQKPQPRAMLQEPFLQVMAEMIPFSRTALLNGVGVDGIKIGSEDEAPNVTNASDTLVEAAINGDRWIPLVGGLQTEDLAHTAPTKIEDYFMALQSYDNMRKSLHGIPSSGVFEKKAHMLQAEQNLNMAQANSALQNKTLTRQTFCNIVNSVWPLGMWWEPSESGMEGDMNGDGVILDTYEEGGESNDEY